MPGHKANLAQQKKREKFKKIHPEGRKRFAIKKKITKIERQIITLENILEQLKIKESKMK